MAKRKDSPTTANKKAERFNGETLRAAVTWAVDVQIFAPLKRHGNTTWQVVDLILLAVAWVLSNGLTASPFGYSFHLAVTVPIVGTGIIWALAMGVVGGLLPALRAARVPVTMALRAT